MKKLGLKFIHWILFLEARKVIRRHDPFVIGVTGSVGKSSTKEAIYQVLYDKFGAEVRKSHGNFNSELGLPLSILGYGEKKRISNWVWPFFLFQAYLKTFQKTFPKYLVLELGVDKPGDIAYFGRILKFDMVVITSAAGAHLGNFDSLADYQNEKISLTKELKPGGLVIANADDPILSKINLAKIIFYSIYHKSDFYAESVQPSLEGTDYRICSLGQKISVKSKLLGSQFVASSLPAFIIGHQFGIQSLKIKKSLERIEPLPGRMRLLEGKRDCIIIDDTYNSSPTSAKAALDVLEQIKYSGRKVAILGNMNELGRFELDEHKSLGDYSRDKADLTVFVGKNAGIMAIANGKRDKVLVYDNRADLSKNLNKIVKPKDLVLVKASQNGNFFEETSKQLMKNPEKASELLVRQSKFWLKKKR
ncbi:hypothetical protein COT78_01475 [Candidatus Berkelbacteria bacterium CG10_big_fil_rev_8_21_14_0_10_43_13]|uniref:UDP-N-acetylmuramoyl-tripeptide--D-alanyl-D-alanine ligase n=1 Tax=Candidatus Berkelbacteria bacterium CG10_big_fil_rev_8_21_14_0_10_43_13 TaxID=1974514 RepID=A0A2H0W720_9BACT|nr:MAG: hypothetical protein COT78_01475 [Candidatus Berkelbacteria bacterium CG10_big_fil_rev_8_21_14_0_10_43_13]